MKKAQTLFILLIALFVPVILQAQHNHTIDTARLTRLLEARATEGVDSLLSAPDSYGTPLVIKLARQGEVQTLLSLTQYPSEGKFLFATDKYGNNLFHVAKNADTVQAIASLVRRFYGNNASKQIARLADTPNLLGERPLNAQINAAHADTFRPIYTYTSLKKKNDVARAQLSRLHGADERIFKQNKTIYCQDITAASSAGGQTLLQAAQAQITYHPQMEEVAQMIERIFPCLSDHSL